MSAILNNQIQPVSETRLSSLAMTSVLSHWLTAKPFVFSLYKCDTTRMVGRPVNSTAIYTSLLISLNNTFCIYNQVFFLNHPPNISLIPYIYLHSYTSHQSPTYTYTAYISLIPHICLHSLHLINPLHILTHPTFHYISSIPHIYLHSLHLINPLHIPTQPTSH